MNLYCPRCDTTLEEIDPAAAESGLCSTCQGQLGAGSTAVDSPLVTGLVAMGFSDDSPVGTPIQLQLNNELVEAGADYEAITSARTAELAKVAAENAAKKAAAEAAAAEAAAAEAAAKAAEDTPVPAASPALEMPTMPSVDDPPPGVEANESGEQNPEAAAAQPKDAAAVPSNLDMPSFDFSMPSLPSFGMPTGEDSVGDTAPGEAEGEPPADAPAADPAAEAAAAPAAGEAAAPAADASGLPAHLQLPSFPKLDVDYDQSAGADQAAAPQPDPGTPDGLPLLPGQEPAAMGPPALTPPAGMPAHLMPGALPQDGPPVAPPTQPEPTPEPPEPDPLALPDLGLPDLPAEEAKREPTLLAQEAASELAEELAKRRSPLPIILGALIVLVVIGGAAFWQRDTLIAAITGEAPGPVVLTAEQKADAALADGLLIAKEANALKGAAQKAKLKEAIAKYQEAIELKPKLAQAHVRLAVAFAKTNEKAKAVKHYEKFVEADPKSKQAKEVQKIIDDWYKAQKDKGEEPKKEEPAPKKKKKKKR